MKSAVTITIARPHDTSGHSLMSGVKCLVSDPEAERTLQMHIILTCHKQIKIPTQQLSSFLFLEKFIEKKRTQFTKIVPKA